MEIAELQRRVDEWIRDVGVDLTAAVEANFAKKSARDSERHKNNPKLKNKGE